VITLNEVSAISNKYLFLGGLFSLAFAIFQISGIFFPPDLIVYFGGPVELQAENPFLYSLLCLIIGIIVATAGLYALSGAGKFRRLPFLRTVLIAITAIYLLRGLNIILEIISMFKHSNLYLMHSAVFSLIAFCIGIIHLTGVIQLLKHNRSERIKTQ
jgi:putative oxidoreductase